MEEELNAFMKNDRCRLVAPRFGVNAIDPKWIFKIKRHANSAIER
jgi:hypothetical protein